MFLSLYNTTKNFNLCNSFRALVLGIFTLKIVVLRCNPPLKQLKRALESKLLNFKIFENC